MSDWTPSASGSAAFAVIAGYARSGVRSGRIRASSSTATLTLTHTSVTVCPGTTYTAQMWARSSATANGCVGTLMVNGIVVATPGSSVNIWVSVAGAWTAPEGVTSAAVSVRVQCTGPAANKDYYIDDVTFVASQN